MNVQRKLRDAPGRFDYHRSHADVRYETPIHDVDVNVIGSGSVSFYDLLAQPGEVGCQDRWGDSYMRHAGSPH